MDRKYAKKYVFAYFPWWANGRYSPGLGSCAGVIGPNPRIPQSCKLMAVGVDSGLTMKGLWTQGTRHPKLIYQQQAYGNGQQPNTTGFGTTRAYHIPMYISTPLPLAYHGYLWYPRPHRPLNLVFDHKPMIVFVPEKWPPYFWYVAAGVFFLRKMAPRFLEAPNLWVRCRGLFFYLFSEKWPPYFWKPLTCGWTGS